MNESELLKVLDKINNPSRDKLEIITNKFGTLNDVDYYIESMKKYYNEDLSEDGRLIIKSFKDGMEIHL